MESKQPILRLVAILVVLVIVVTLGITVFTIVTNLPVKPWDQEIRELTKEGGYFEKDVLYRDFHKQKVIKPNKLTARGVSELPALTFARGAGVPGAETSLSAFNEAMPVERINKIDADHLCVITRLDAGEGKPNVFEYRIFDRRVEGDLEIWYADGEVYYISASHEAKDFEGLTAGASVGDAAAIEPALTLQRERSATIAEDASFLMLTDGILVLRWDGEQLTVKEFYSYDGEKPSFSCAVFATHALPMP